MKKLFKKSLCVFLASLLACSAFGISSLALETGDTGSVSILNYNTGGLYDFDSILAGEGDSTPDKQTATGKFVNSGSWDIFATQEDFYYTQSLSDELTNYRIRTVFTGGIPVGDGLMLYSREISMYNEKRIKWNVANGIVADGADEFTPKGILYVCMEIGDGVYIDFYNIHADSFGSEGDVAARRAQFQQLADLINSREIDRPVIVTGDFNAVLRDPADGLYDILLAGCGLKDAWAEKCNGGNYTDFTHYEALYGSDWGSAWGVWDSVERFLYKGSENVSLDCDSFNYLPIVFDEETGELTSDHHASEAVFSYCVNIPLADDGDKKVVLQNMFVTMFEHIKNFFRAIILALKNAGLLKDFIGSL